ARGRGVLARRAARRAGRLRPPRGRRLRGRHAQRRLRPPPALRRPRRAARLRRRPRTLRHRDDARPHPARRAMRRLALGLWPSVVVGLLLLAGPVHAQGNGLAFLALDPDPAGQGVGGAYAAAADGPFAPLFNPAGLATEGDNAAALAVQDWLGDARTVAVG